MTREAREFCNNDEVSGGLALLMAIDLAGVLEVALERGDIRIPRDLRREVRAAIEQFRRTHGEEEPQRKVKGKPAELSSFFPEE
ncbi:MAG: hypothetical protein ABSC19_01525 [Syntrophorhabdales bacterium]|jgi:hypothetical protein